MERTQIYLSKAQANALDREARRTGTTRSHLIREAIEARYGTASGDADRVRRALRATAGLWRDREESGVDHVERMRSERRLRDAIERSDEAGPHAQDR